MVDPFQYCGGAKELDKFLQILQSNFASRKHLFPRGDPDQVKYAVSLLDTRNNHPDMTQQLTDNKVPAEWASDQREVKVLCLDDFELFANELQKMNEDIDRRLNSAKKAMQECQQLPNEAVRVYINCLKANLR